jgi:hypothetical protein
LSDERISAKKILGTNNSGKRSFIDKVKGRRIKQDDN